MKNKRFFFSAILVPLFSFSIYATQLSGLIRDAMTHEVLIGANVYEKNQNTGTTADNRGYFSLKVKIPCTLSISYTGFKSQQISIESGGDSLLIVELQSDNQLNEITVTASKDRSYDVTRLSSKELELIPTLGGKPDVIKALQLLPGVQTQSEGMSIMLVRGGEPGQNQYLLDNVPLTYVNHLGGFMSVFNPDMINSVDFYKGNFPARQGGKLSSIVDITQREGDISKHQGSFSLGVTDASFTFEGPLAKKKMSYIVTARKTLIDAFLAGASIISEGNNAIAAYGFYDVNAKLTWRPDNKNNLSLNLYQGDDYLNFWTKPWKIPKNESSHINQQWGNWLVSGRWNLMLGTKLYAENIVSYSRYRNLSGQQLGYENNGVKTELKTENMASVKDFSLRSAWKYSFLSNWNIEYGGQISYLIYEPDYNYLSTSATQVINNIYNGIESAVYLDNKIKLLPGLLFEPALRLNHFVNNGESFTNIEPRVNISYKLNLNQSFNINYMQVSQNSHLVFVQSEILKREVWLPATSVLAPELSNQISLSWNGIFNKGKYSAEANIYYKKMEHLVTLKEGYENMVNLAGVENKIEVGGTGIAYGGEFMFKKNTGKWTGSLSYAWSYADRRFANVNNGLTYEYDFNRPHNIVFTVNHDLGNNWTVNAVWLFQTGTPFTPALGKQYIVNPETGKMDVELIYGKKNSERMGPYHRLDVGFNHTIITKRGNKAIWTYSIYNAYNHINPFSYYYDNDNNIENQTYYKRPLQLYKMGLFSIIPSISYKVYFDYRKKSISPVKEKKVKKFNWLYY